MSQPTLPQAILLAAAEWLQKRTQDEDFDQAAFDAWLTADPRHEEAWRRTLSMWESFDEYRTAPEILSLRTRVLKSAFQREKRRWSLDMGRPDLGRRGLLVGGAGIAAAAVAGVGVTFFSGREKVRIYETGIGEMRTLLLPDKSLITLDASSRIQTRFNDSSRQIRLTQGRAHFEVAHDAARPFQVNVEGLVVTALGTDFTVDRREKSMSVALFNGKVMVADKGNARRRSHELQPLQALTLSYAASEDFSLRTLDPVQDLAWREGRLIFDSERLVDAIARMNTYSPTKITVAGEAGDLRISGMFMAGQTEAFVEALEAYYPLTVEKSANGRVIRAQNP
ncbi:MAG: FecR domain-containing protein [Asticcacaulis sp.]